ncbi:MAG: hypothetical protein A2W07_02810 [candidate division Zixibacteria bacterium RBG_16_43_9]|nr:MAG: hypothetical protein A2W07_02810 [candidate division Zixibacteria bacterium RBG_16_43_9]
MPTERIILLIQILLLGTGLTLGIIARFYRAAGQPFFSFNPKYWIPVWKMKDMFRPPGYELNLIGTLMILVGVVWSLMR